MTNKEMKVLNKIANEWFGCDYDNLDYEEQDQIYCYAEENGEF